MVVGGSECMLGHPPSRGEDDKVSDGNSGLPRWTGEYSEDAGILGMTQKVSSYTAQNPVVRNAQSILHFTSASSLKNPGEQ